MTITKIYNKYLEEGTFSIIWKKAEVIWLGKPGGGYRPISLLPTLGRILDKIITSRVAYQVETKQKLEKNQYGFRKGHTTTQAGGRVVKRIKSNKDRENHSLLVTFDMSNAFNTAWAPATEIEMNKKEIPYNLTNICMDFLSNRSIQTGNIIKKLIERAHRVPAWGQYFGSY